MFNQVRNVLTNTNTHIPAHVSYKHYFRTFLPMSDMLVQEIKGELGSVGVLAAKHSHKGVKNSVLKRSSNAAVKEMQKDAPQWASFPVYITEPFWLMPTYDEIIPLLGEYFQNGEIIPCNERGMKFTKFISKLINKTEGVNKTGRIDIRKVDVKRLLEQLYKSYINFNHCTEGTVYITANYSDMLLCSTDRGWTSCYRVDGCYGRSTVSSWENGDLLAIFVKEDSTAWNARCILRLNPGKGYWTESNVYGDGSINEYTFGELLRSWLIKNKLGTEDTGTLHPDFRGYSDFHMDSFEPETKKIGGLDLIEDQLNKLFRQNSRTFQMMRLETECPLGAYADFTYMRQRGAEITRRLESIDYLLWMEELDNM